MSKQKGLMYNLEKDVGETFNYVFGTKEGQYLLAKGMSIGVGLFGAAVYYAIPEHATDFLADAKATIGMATAGCFSFTAFSTLSSAIYQSDKKKKRELKSVRSNGGLEEIVEDSQKGKSKKYVESDRFKRR